MMESQKGWKWYGYAGHLCVGRSCAYHLCTRVGDYLISTVGDYYYNDKRETIGAGKDDFFETFVFECTGEDADGNPVINLSEIDGERYAESLEAEKGHYRYCLKYAAGKEANYENNSSLSSASLRDHHSVARVENSQDQAVLGPSEGNEEAVRLKDIPDANCITAPDGSCVALGPCMHTPTTGKQSDESLRPPKRLDGCTCAEPELYPQPDCPHHATDKAPTVEPSGDVEGLVRRAYTRAANCGDPYLDRLLCELASTIRRLVSENDSLKCEAEVDDEAKSRLSAQLSAMREALEPFADAVNNDNGDVTITLPSESDYLKARAALQRED